jgi:dienelactone hydrolase
MMLRWPAALWLACLPWLAAAQQVVSVPSLDQRDGMAVPLKSHWFAAAEVAGGAAGDAAGRRPAVLLLHGCGGPYNRRGELSERMREYAALLNAEGWHALVLDSFTTRGLRELCTTPMAARAVDQSHRRQDALGALAWLAAQSHVDPQRLALLGWSHGGSTVLAASNARHRSVADAPVRPAAAVAFYPGCSAERDRGYSGTAPLLLLVGEADDWTPPRPCRELAQQAGHARPPVRLVTYPGAFHGFDSQAPVRHRTDVPNGVNPGQGVRLGGQPAAREASRQALMEFLRQHLR